MLLVMTTLLDPETGEPIIQTNILDDDTHSDAGHSDAPTSRPQLQAGRVGDNVLESLRRIKRDSPTAIKQLLERRAEHIEHISELNEHLAMLGHQDEPTKTRKPRGPNRPKLNGAASEHTPVAAAAPAPAVPAKRRGRPPAVKTDAAPAGGDAPKKRGWPKGQKRGPRKKKFATLARAVTPKAILHQ